MSGRAIAAGIDILADGVSVRLLFSICPEASEPASEDSTAGGAFEAGEGSPAQALLRAAAAAVPALQAAFEQASSIVLQSQCILVEQRLAALKKAQSTEPGGTA